MDTTPPVTTPRTDDSSVTDNIQNDENSPLLPPTSILQTVERIVTPIQPPLQPGTPVRQQPTGGFTSTANSANPTFAVLKTTTIQHAIGHPLAYVRVLMQMGYEPLPAYRGKNLFGKETLYYPNVFRYLQYIYNTDGFLGLYRGFGCSLLSKVVCWYTTTKVDELLGPVEPRVPNSQEKPTWNKCTQKVLREVRCQSWGILVSHPFQVMAVRCMGQFVGGEKAYSSLNIFQNFKEIYQHQGIGGFFVGLIPRWLLEISTIVIANVIVHLLKTQLPSQNELVSLYEYIAAFVAQTVTYPLSVVTTVTAINRSGLRAGTLPLTPIHSNWHDAYNYLKTGEQLKRGSGLFNRAALGTSGLPALGTPIPNA
ncbi:unnamed protein product [Adineta steineri]|uniref:Uncharacterized protein n=1 Tax=Adineta steineri TaxID=433720 RepID=A0A818X229_9BILA|nr:unnamed protein product [Adineta steineri]CAF1011884.1 unnamed protein product [Adineta steineri]CAF3683292.1 unnamed protein product [Adineta steineri]CAF3734505.1 unnamed protein product [Adineta steineri]